VEILEQDFIGLLKLLFLKKLIQQALIFGH